MVQSTQFQPIVATNLSTIIVDNETESDAIDLSGTTLVAIAFPAEFDGTKLTLKAAQTSDAAYVNVHESNGLALTIAGTASQIVTIEPAKLAGLQYIKLVADNAQAGDSIFTLMTRPV